MWSQDVTIEISSKLALLFLFAIVARASASTCARKRTIPSDNSLLVVGLNFTPTKPKPKKVSSALFLVSDAIGRKDQVLGRFPISCFRIFTSNDGPYSRWFVSVLGSSCSQLHSLCLCGLPNHYQEHQT